MFGGRLVLAFGICGMLVCLNLSSQVAKSSATRFEGLRNYQSPPSMVRHSFSDPARPRSVSEFRQWRYRMKSVLVEMTDPTVEEFDFGPAVTTGRLISISSLELTSRRLETLHPLRC